MRGRLRYLARIVQATPHALMALLFATPKGKQMPGRSLIIEDMRTLKGRVSLCGHLPDPKVESRKWADFMVHKHEKWSFAVSTLYFVKSRRDSRTIGHRLASFALQMRLVLCIFCE